MTASSTDPPLTLPARRRFRFTLKQFLVVVAIVAVLLAIWAGLLRKVVTIRPATRDDPIRESYFPIYEDDVEFRNVAVVQGVFSRSTSLSASLFALQGRQIQELNAISVGRTSSAIGDLPWETMTITLALGTRDTPDGRVIQVGSAGQTAGGGRSHPGPVPQFATDFSDTFAGTIPSGSEYVIYAEGDSKIDMKPYMTVAEFAQRNPGNYLVVTAQLR